MVKLADLETQIMQLTRANSGLTEDVTRLTNELNNTRDEATKAKTEREALLKKVESSSKDTAPNNDEQAQKIATLEILVQEWTDLAKRSYQEYKEILPLSKQADQFRKDLVQKEETIKDLQEKLALAEGSQSGDDVRYWKTKYETLLESISR